MQIAKTTAVVQIAVVVNTEIVLNPNGIGLHFLDEVGIKFKEILESKFNIPVVLQDERLTTVEAHNYMIAADMSRKKRKKKVDALAANIILQTYIDKERGGRI